jgi:hypothetical protein
MQKRLAAFLLACGSIALIPGVAFGQEQGNTGITMGYPESFGVVVHVTDRFALRPEVTLSRASSEVEQALGDRGSRSWSVGVGLSGLFYVAEWDRVRAYVSPRYTYTRLESSIDLAPTFSGTSTSKTDSHLFVWSFGAQYWPHDHFSVFGEIGLGFSVQNSRSSLTSATGEGHTLGTRTGAGIIFYF